MLTILETLSFAALWCAGAASLLIAAIGLLSGIPSE